MRIVTKVAEDGDNSEDEENKENDEPRENGIESTTDGGRESQTSNRERETGDESDNDDMKVRQRLKRPERGGDSESEAEADDGGAKDKARDSDDEEKLHFDDVSGKKKKTKNMDKIPKISHSVHAPHFPVDKQEFWWVYLVDKKQQLLTTVPFLMTNLVEEEDAILKLSAPHRPGIYHYTLHVKSDSYVEVSTDSSVGL